MALYFEESSKKRGLIGSHWREMWRKKKFGNKRAVDNREISKRMRFLQYRGFDFDQIKYAISSSIDQ